MRHQQNAVLITLRRAQRFLDEHNDVLAAVNASTRKQLDDVVTQLSDLSVAQDGGKRGSKGESARHVALRLALRRNYMAPIAELAKFRLRAVPEFAALTLPPSNAPAESIVAAAYAMADAATIHAQTLIDNGLPSTFAEDLRTAAAAVNAASADRGTQLNRRTGATAGLAVEERRGRSMLRVLNALIMVHIGTDEQLSIEWAGAKMVRRKPGPVAGTPAAHPTPIHVVPVTPMPAPAPLPVPVTPSAAVAA